MLVDFFYALKDGKVPVSLKEFLDLQAALKADLVYANVDEFYSLSRTILVKDEKYYDKFDQAFAKYFEGIEASGDEILMEMIPEEWLRGQLEKTLNPDEIEKLSRGDLEKLIDQYHQKMEEIKKGRSEKELSGQGEGDNPKADGDAQKGF